MNLQEQVKLKNELLTLFDKALADGNWEASLYFRTVGKRLRELRQCIIDEIDTEDKSKASRVSRSLAQPKEGYIKVYVSIYQADGANIDRWRSTVKSLADYSINRPIYRAQEHIEAILRAKTDIKREAYVIVHVKENSIIQQYPGRAMTDRFGNELITLKEGSVKLENIIEFVHEGKRYSIDHGEFVL
jgi:intracellular multiplication protein IcmQ